MKKLSFLLVLFFVIACNSKSSFHNGSRTKYFHEGRFLVRELYDSNGKIQSKKYFNHDTLSDGAEFIYYPNGHIEKWKWYDITDKYPYGTVYYDTDGRFDTFTGRPFIGTGYDHKHQLCVELLNPPNVNVAMGYRDFINNKLIREILYPPSLTDTISWVILNGHKPEKNHKYMLYYYFLDSANHILLGSPIELENHENEK